MVRASLFNCAASYTGVLVEGSDRAFVKRTQAAVRSRFLLKTVRLLRALCVLWKDESILKDKKRFFRAPLKGREYGINGLTLGAVQARWRGLEQIIEMTCWPRNESRAKECAAVQELTTFGINYQSSRELPKN